MGRPKVGTDTWACPQWLYTQAGEAHYAANVTSNTAYTGCINDERYACPETVRGAMYLNSRITANDVDDGMSNTLFGGETLRSYRYFNAAWVWRQSIGWANGNNGYGVIRSVMNPMASYGDVGVVVTELRLAASAAGRCAVRLRCLDHRHPGASSRSWIEMSHRASRTNPACVAAQSAGQGTMIPLRIPRSPG